jgi:uncharacterized membrane protein
MEYRDTFSMKSPNEHDSTRTKKSPTTLKQFIWRGISLIAPPLVTLLVLIWLFNAIEDYVLTPLETGVRYAAVLVTADVYEEAPPGAELRDEDKPEAGFKFEGFNYVRPPIGRRFIPEHIINYVDANQEYLPKEMQRPLSAYDYYADYIKLRYMPRSFTIPLLLLLVFSGLFFLGRFFAAGVGRFMFNAFEGLISQVPVVSNVYSSVKQVTDFVLSDREMEFTRVVAVEYPRADIWSIGFVTSEGIPQLKSALNDDLVAVFLPCSPMPMTGYTINIARRSVVDLDLTIDQAIQFMVSCGVVCPVDRVVIESQKISAMLKDNFNGPDKPE